MCMRPCGPIRYYRPKSVKYVEIKQIKSYSLAEARKIYSDNEVLETAKKIYDEKPSWTWTETKDRYVIEKLFDMDPLMARIAITEKNRQKIQEMVA